MDERERADAIKDLDTLATGMMADITQSARLAWEAKQRGDELEGVSQWERFVAALEQLDRITSIQKRLKEDPRATVFGPEEKPIEHIAKHPETGILRCRYCGAPYAYRENLELHERGCPRRGRA